MSLGQNQGDSSSNPSSSDSADEAPPELPIKRTTRKKKAPSRPGPETISKEERKSKKQLRDERRAAYVRELQESGELSKREADKFLGNTAYSRQREDYEQLREELIATKDDPDLYEKNKRELERFEKTRKNLINEIGGTGVQILTRQEMNTIMELLATGMGRYAACHYAKIVYLRFFNTFKHDEEFRAAVIAIERSLIGYCEMQIYTAGQNGDIAAAEKFIRIKTNQNESIFSRKLAKAEYELKKQAADAALGAIQQDNRPSFTCLNDKELEDYNNLVTKIASGQDPTSEEATRLGSYQARLIKANSPLSASK